MKKIIKRLNQNGVTLLEILLSITILSIILVTVINIFPQMGLINQKNEDKSQAVNTAIQVMIEWQNNQEVKNFLINQSGPIPNYLTKSGVNYTSESSKDGVKVSVKIAGSSDFDSDPKMTSPTKVHQIHVQLKNNQNNLVGESFGYIIVGE